MTTSKELSESIDKFGATALAIKAERDRLKESHAELLAAAKYAFEQIDDHYDVDQSHGESAVESPFEGAGEVLRSLQAAIEKAGKL